MRRDAKMGVTLGMVALAAAAVRLALRKEHGEVADAKEKPGQAGASVGQTSTAGARPVLTTPLDCSRIVIYKSKRKLILQSAGKPVRTCRIALGFEPTGDKEREGDGRTPEGEFYVCNRNRDSKYCLSLGLSYPNAEDAARGLRDGLITEEQHDAIVRAIAHGERPPWDTALGGEIFIHGNGASRDWTLGCIALEDEDIREVFEAVPVGTPVVIHP